MRRSGGDQARGLSRLMSRLQSDQAYRRKVFLRGAWAAIGGIALVSAVFFVLAFVLAPDLADGIALAGDVLVAATLLLAVIAAAVAVLAYTVSTGAPELQVSVRFPFSQVNAPLFKARRIDGEVQAEDFKQVNGEIYLRNENQYPASSPAVIVRLHRMAFKLEGLTSGWVVTGFGTTVGVTEVQWDGGSSYSVHGHSRRRLPDLRLAGLTLLPTMSPDPEADPPRFVVELLADGYRRSVTLDAGFQVDDVVIGPRWLSGYVQDEWM